MNRNRRKRGGIRAAAYVANPLITISNVVLLPDWLYFSSQMENMGSESIDGSSGSAAARAGRSERRANPRYELTAEFDLFQLRGAKHRTWLGSGKTRNWSRSSILIVWDKPLDVGTSVELVVRWSTTVEMVVVGRILSNEARGTVVRVLRGRFRVNRAYAEKMQGTQKTALSTHPHEHAS